MTPAQSWRLPLLLLLPVVISQATTDASDTLSCFYNSRANISCVWSPSGRLPNSTCRVSAKSDLRSWQKFCKLLPVAPASWTCDLILNQNPDMQMLTAADNIHMSVECQEDRSWMTATRQNFSPFNYLRLFAPTSLQVTLRETYLCSNVTWRVPFSSHYIESYLEYEVQKRTLNQMWEDTPVLILKQNQKWICLENLAPDTQYELRVRVWPQKGEHPAWSPWSETLAFRTWRAASTKKTQPYSWLYPLIWAVSGTAGFILLTYFLATNQHMGSWLKKLVKCHIPDPSEFFVQLSSEHGGDFQKWLSSPFPSSAFSPGGLAPEISPLEVLDNKAAQLLRLQQDKGPAPPSPGSLSLTSCFTNQGYFFFHLPDALEIEACQVYFTYDPCEEEPEEGAPGAPGAPLLPALPVQPAEGDAYCTFPPGDDLLLAPVRPGSTASGGSGAGEDWHPPSLQNGVPGDDVLQAPELPSLGAPSRAPLSLDSDLGQAGEEAPGASPVEGPGLPWAGPPGSGQLKAVTSYLASNPDAYLSLKELQDHSV